MGRSVYCVVTAAGSGSRLGNPGPKALVELAGHTLLHHALRSLEPLDDLAGVVITAPGDYLDTFTEIARTAALSYPWKVVAGGANRQISVYQGLQGLLTFETGEGIVPAKDPEAIVLIHDAARALTPRAQFQRVCLAVVSGCPAVVPATPLVDTVREIAGESFCRAGVEITLRSYPRSLTTALRTNSPRVCRGCYFCGSRTGAKTKHFRGRGSR